MSETLQNTNVWRKLLEIQKALKTFATDENSEKKTQGGKSAYQYTPGWKIVETVRAEMDRAGLMLVPDYRKEDVQMIEYPLYKLVGGNPVTFIKKEIHIVVSASFTWVDPASGETAGPFSMVASGANGTDKSCASALALAERYFLLKFFHITTREKDEEIDAHDSGTVPGIPAGEQPSDAATHGSPVGEQMQAPRPVSMGVNVRAGLPAGPGTAPQKTVTAPADSGFNAQHPIIASSIARLSQFKAGTTTFNKEMTDVVRSLERAGYSSMDPGFINHLIAASQAVREGKVA